jgi:hypothetical protein
MQVSMTFLLRRANVNFAGILRKLGPWIIPGSLVLVYETLWPMKAASVERVSSQSKPPLPLPPFGCCGHLKLQSCATETTGGLA